MEIEEPIIDADLIEALRKYAPAAHDALFEEMHFIAAWKRAREWVGAMSSDGYRPLALLIHDFSCVDWNVEMKAIRETVEKIEQQGPDAAVGLAGKLHKLRHSRMENIAVTVEWLKKVVADGHLVIRHGKPPYLPIVDERRYCLDIWFKSTKAETGFLWDRFPDGRAVLKISEVVELLSKTGVAVPDRYRAFKKVAVELLEDARGKPIKKRDDFTKKKLRAIDNLMELFKQIPLDPIKTPVRVSKPAVRELAEKVGRGNALGPAFAAESSFDNLWTAARALGYIAG